MQCKSKVLNIGLLPKQSLASFSITMVVRKLFWIFTYLNISIQYIENALEILFC